MVKVGSIFDRIVKTYTSKSNIAIILHVKGHSKSYIINGSYWGILSTGEKCIVVHTRGYYHRLNAIELTDRLKENRLHWDNATPLVFDNHNSCHLITQVRYDNYAVHLYVDLENNNVDIIDN